MKTLDLTGRWLVRCDNSTDDIPATVPGCVHTDLLAAGIIEDPFFRDRENDIEWIGEAA